MDKHEQHLPKWKAILFAIGIVVAGVGLAVVGWWAMYIFVPGLHGTVTVQQNSSEKPSLTTEPVVTGYSNIWDVAFLPNYDMLFTERKGIVHIGRANGQVHEVFKIPDIYARGEGGLMGIAVDPRFEQNNFIYTCYNSQTNGENRPDVRVVRWSLTDGSATFNDRKDIVAGMPSNTTGRHSGCRIKFGVDGYLYVGTGDSAFGGAAIDHKNLGGKILRVDRDGKAAPDNLGGDFDPRIYSYGHRNVQGIAMFAEPKNGIVGVSVEHGSSADDEVNPLKKGNFGWAHPTGLYTELNVPMTDKVKYPDAIDSLWSSGFPTIAPSGAAILNGPQWKQWDGALAVAVLKARHLKIMSFNGDGAIDNTEDLFLAQFGRIRSATLGPDGDLYITTDNGSDDKVIRVTPK